MKPIISIVGTSNTGKTTLLEALIAELKRRGYKLAIMKHSTEDVELDTPDKDTWRFTRAGSDVSAIISGNKLAIFRRLEHEFSPQDLYESVFWDYDLILTEGFKKSAYPKIEVHRKGAALVSPPEQLIAVVTDEPLNIDVPQFSREETGKIADLIESKIKTTGDELDLIINGKRLQVNSSSGKSLSEALVTLLSSLEGIQQINDLRISLRRKLDI